MIRVECPVCGRVMIITNPVAIANAQKGIQIVCDVCVGIQTDEYVRGFHNDSEVICDKND